MPQPFSDLVAESGGAPDLSMYLTLAFCLISVLCSISLLFLMATKNLHVGPCQFMFICLTVADFMAAAGNFTGVLRQLRVLPDELTPTNRCNSSDLCVGQSFVTTWSSMVSFLCTIVIELYCFRAIWDDSRRIEISRITKIVLSTICWGVPLSITIAALISQVLGEDDSKTSGGWCWIVSECSYVTTRARILWMLFAGKLWEVLSYLTIANLILVNLVKVYVRRKRHHRYFLFTDEAIFDEENMPIISSAGHREDANCETASDQSPSPYSTPQQNSLDSPSVPNSPTSDTSHNSETAMQECKLLFWIPMCLILARVWGTIRFVFNIIEITNGGLPHLVVKANSVFLYLHGIGDSSQATCNFILVLIFRKEIRYLFCCRQRRLQH